jgi:hypothetical protein
VKIYTLNKSDASIKIKNKIVNVKDYYTFRDGIILNTCLMTYSNVSYSYRPFIQVRYDNNDNSYSIRIQCIINSDIDGYNFDNSVNDGSIIIYYI